MQNETLPRVTMASPEPGFTSRVMARIDKRERARARRRAFVGVVVLVTAIGFVLASAVAWVASWISIIAQPETIAPMVMALTLLFDGWEKLFEGLVIVASVIAQNVGEVPLLVYACAVLAMTALWVQIITGSFQRLLNLQIRGLR